MKTCTHCGKEVPEYVNYCDWACHIEHARKLGGRVHTPNGLPIKCIKADGTMLEIEHGDHPDYKFPVEIEYTGSEFEDAEGELAMYGRRLSEQERLRSRDETHALIYTDGSVAVTMSECCYSFWHLRDGECAGGSQCRPHKDWRLTEASRMEILRRCPPAAEVCTPEESLPV